MVNPLSNNQFSTGNYIKNLNDHLKLTKNSLSKNEFLIAKVALQNGKEIFAKMGIFSKINICFSIQNYPKN